MYVKEGGSLFFSSKFIFNNIRSDDMRVCLVTFDSDVFKDMGTYAEELSTEENFNGNVFYTIKDAKPEDVVLNIMLLNEHNQPLIWDDESTSNIMDWLITNKFAPFISEDNLDIVYYFKAIKITKKFTTNKMGYLEVTFARASNFAFKRISTSSVVDGEASVNVLNCSNVDMEYKPIIKIINHGGTSVSITNKSTDTTLILDEISEKEVITVDNLMCTVLNENNESKMGNCNRKWIGLKKGNNLITINGHCQVEILAEFPVIN